MEHSTSLSVIITTPVLGAENLEIGHLNSGPKRNKGLPTSQVNHTRQLLDPVQ